MSGKATRPCGTPAAYKRHREHGEEVCDPCRIAHNKANSVYKKKARGTLNKPVKMAKTNHEQEVIREAVLYQLLELHGDTFDRLVGKGVSEDSAIRQLAWLYPKEYDKLCKIEARTIKE